MDLANKLSNYISQLNVQIVDEPSVSNIQSRDIMIQDLTDILATLANISNAINKKIVKYKEDQQNEIQSLENFIASKKKGNGHGWTTVGSNGKTPKKSTLAISSTSSTSSASLTITPTISILKREIVRAPIKISELVSITATVVQSFDQVMQNGDIYYIEPCAHFAIKIAGKLFHGNIGRVYNDERAHTPSKIKACKYAPKCDKSNKCDFYHDPMIFKGSADTRNFIADSWIYTPVTSKHDQRGAMGRKVSSRDSLDVDLLTITDEDVSKYGAQLMHDLLVNLAIDSNKS